MFPVTLGLGGKRNQLGATIGGWSELNTGVGVRRPACKQDCPPRIGSVQAKHTDLGQNGTHSCVNIQ